MLGDWINTIFQSIMLWIDSVIYWFAAQCYQLFMKLSVTQIFDENFFNNFATRIYSILGVFMLFYLAYALLNALVDPDKLARGDKSVSKIAQNLVVSLVILGLLPSIFSYAYRLQNYILSSNVIGSLIFGTPTIDPTVESDDSLIRYGDAISFTVLNTFLNSDDYNVRLDNDYTWYDVKYEILHDGNYSKLSGLSDPIVHETTVLSGEDAGKSVNIDYKVGISSLAGIYLCYIMLSFTLDLGVRVVKLAFCQLIAPIPVVMRAVPGKNGTFDKWLKLTLSVYFEIFVRVAFMYISIYFINGLTTSNVFDNFFSGGIQGMLALVIIILGILTFAKQAPKMISDMLGIDTGNMKLGIGEKMKGNFLGKSIWDTGSRAVGAVTGSIGAGLSSIANGGGPAGFLFGAANGWKNKGLQFGKQHQEMYSKITGDYKGKAGLFGGVSLGTNVYNYMTGLAPAIASKRRQEDMEKFENKIIETRRKEFEAAEKEKKKLFDEANKKELDNLKEQLEARRKVYEEDKAKQIADINRQSQESQSAFDRNKAEKIKGLKIDYERAKDNQNMMEMARINRELQATESSSFDNSKFMNDIKRLNEENFESTEEAIALNKKIEEISSQTYVGNEFNETAIREQIHKDYDKHLDKLDQNYKQNMQEKKERLVDSSSKKYHANVVNSDRLGEARATNQQKEAFEKVLKDLGYKKEDKK